MYKKTLSRCLFFGVALLTSVGVAGVTAPASHVAAAVKNTSTAGYQRIAPIHKLVKPNMQKRIWNLDNADIRAVIATMAQLTGRTFLVDPMVNGKVSIMSKKPMTVAQLYQVFLTMLQTLNYTAVSQGMVSRIVPLDNAKQYANTSTDDSGESTTSQQVVVSVVPVEHVSAMQLITVLQPLMPNSGLINAYTPSNSIVLSGTQETVNRLTKLIHNLDEKSTTELIEVKLKHATADTLVKLLQQLQTNDVKEGKTNTVSYAADKNTNAILVSGSKVNLAQAKKLITRLDESSDVDSGLTVIHLHYVSAASLVPTLAALAGGSAKSGSTQAASNAQVSNMLGTNTTGSAVGNALGSMMGGQGGQAPSLLQSNSNPMIGADTSGVFQAQPVIAGGGKDFSLVAIPATNSIVVTAPAMIVKRLRKIVKILDVRPKQVLVQAIIVRVDESTMQKLGIQWGTLIDGGTSVGKEMQQGYGLISNHMSIGGILEAVQNDGNSEVLATPSVMVMNNEKAMISDGSNISMPAGMITSGSGDNQTQTEVPGRTNVALSLTVQPQINSNDSVSLRIAQKDNEIKDSGDQSPAQKAQQAVTGPDIDTSTITTHVMVPNGDILVLGGLLRKTRVVSKKGVPVLDKIPLLGRLFEWQSVNHEKQSLLIFLKPIVLATKKQQLAISHLRYRGMRSTQLRAALKDNIRMRPYQPVLPRLKNERVATIPVPFANEVKHANRQ